MGTGLEIKLNFEVVKWWFHWGLHAADARLLSPVYLSMFICRSVLLSFAFMKVVIFVNLKVFKGIKSKKTFILTHNTIAFIYIYSDFMVN